MDQKFYQHQTANSKTDDTACAEDLATRINRDCEVTNRWTTNSQPRKSCESVSICRREVRSNFCQSYHGMLIINARFSEHFKTAYLEPEDQATKDNRDIVELRKTYQWQQGGTKYPPCLLSILEDEQVGLLEIFNLKRLIDTSLAILPPKLVPDKISQYVFGTWGGKTMANLEADMIRLTKQRKNIGEEPSVANRPDWYSDAVFGQMSFTGVNPTSITQASARWIKEFSDTAKKQGNETMYNLITKSEADTFYVQDYSYFREACGVNASATLKSDNKKRFGCAVVTLLQVSKTGNLHPLAICIDYIQSLDFSVVIFNSRLRTSDPTKGEKTDWPWRYAKTCHMISDYYRHELGAHLNNCHFVEEAVIVAASRSFTADHVVYQILEPHWYISSSSPTS
jgi:hypothetical protein